MQDPRLVATLAVRARDLERLLGRPTGLGETARLQVRVADVREDHRVAVQEPDGPRLIHRALEHGEPLGGLAPVDPGHAE